MSRAGLVGRKDTKELSQNRQINLNSIQDLPETGAARIWQILEVSQSGVFPRLHRST
jgi:hypothetical protein